VEEEGQDALEVGPQAHAAKDAQDGAEEGIGLLWQISPPEGDNYLLTQSTFIEAIKW